VVQVIQLVLNKQAFYLWQFLVGNIGDDYVLVRCQLEAPLVNLGDLPQAGLEILLGFVLHAAILDEGGVVMSTVFAGEPTEFVDIAREVKRASRLKLVPESLFNFRLKVLEPHPVDSVLQPGILTTLKASGNITLQTIGMENVLHTVTIIPLDQHDFLRHVFTLLHCAETEDVCRSGICLLVCMRYTHSTSSSDIESGESTFLIHNRNEADIIGKDVDVV